MTGFVIGKEPLTCDRLMEAASKPGSFTLHPDVEKRVRDCRATVDEILDQDNPVYGINTGVGSQKDYRVSGDQLDDFNRKLIRGHATRVPGATATPDVVRAMLIIQLHELASGFSGASPELVELLLDLAASNDLPKIDTSGSVGASDLVPLAQLSDWVLSQPEAVRLGLPKPKDALAMINCNALSLATGAKCIVELDHLLRGFDLAAAAAMEGFRCNLDAISEAVTSVNPRQGQKTSAARIRNFLERSTLWQEGQNRFLQDPLSFRTVSQVHGAGLEHAASLTDVWNDELQGCVINPLVNAGPKPAYSHGNMDTTRMTLALDGMRQVLAKMADLLGERVHKQQWPAFSGLPIGLAEEGAPASGVQFLNLGHITASLITSVKIWASPHLLHSAGQIADGVEDTASNAVHSVHDLDRQIDACWKLIALEVVIAIWAIERRGLPQSGLGAVISSLHRECVDQLPIGREGEEVFSVSALVETVRRFVHALQKNG